MITAIITFLTAVWSITIALVLAAHVVARLERRARRRPCRPRAPYVLVVTETGHLRRIWLHNQPHSEVVRLVRAIEDSNRDAAERSDDRN